MSCYRDAPCEGCAAKAAAIKSQADVAKYSERSFALTVALVATLATISCHLAISEIQESKVTEECVKHHGPADCGVGE